MTVVCRWVCVAACLVGAVMPVIPMSAQAPTYTFSVLAGMPPASAREGAGPLAGFTAPHGIAQDAAGVLYVSDNRAHVIWKILPDGTTTVFAGAIGQAGTTDGQSTAARFSAPVGLAFDPSGTLFVADHGSCAIRRVLPDATVTTWAGLPGTKGSTDGDRAAARFGYVFGLASDAAGSLYVTEMSTPAVNAGGGCTSSGGAVGESVRKITAAGQVSTVAGLTHFEGNADGPIAQARLSAPKGIVVEAGGSLLVTDARNTLRRVSTDGTVSTPFTGLATPIQLALQSDGTLWITEAGSTAGLRRVLSDGSTTIIQTRIDTRGVITDLGVLGGILPRADGTVVLVGSNGLLRTLQPNGTLPLLAGNLGWGQQDGLRTTAGLFETSGIALDRRGQLFVADRSNQTIRRITPAGMVSTLAGLGRHQGGATDGAAADARFRNPQGIAVGPDGRVVIGEFTNATVRVLAAGQVTTLAGTAGLTGSADGQGADARFFRLDGDISLAPDGSAFLIDTIAGSPATRVVRRISSSGAVTTVSGLSLPTSGSASVVVDGDGTRWVLSTQGLVRTLASGETTTFAAPAGRLEVDPLGRVFIWGAADAPGLHRVSADGSVTFVALLPFPNPYAPQPIEIRDLAIGAAGEIYYSVSNSTYFVNQIWMAVPSPEAAPVVSTVANQTVSAGATAQFTATVTGMPTPGLQWQVSSNSGSTWTDVSDAAPYSGTFTSTLSVLATASMSGRQFRLVATNLSGVTTSPAATLTVRGIAAAPAALRFTAWKSNPNAFAPYATTPPQAVNVVVQGAGSAAWTASSNQPWAVVLNGSGTGVGQFTVAIDEPAMRALTGSHAATITIVAPSVALTTTVPVSLSIAPISDSNLPAFGVVDTPVQDSGGVVGALSMTGWALDDVGIERIEIQRSCPAFMCGFLAGTPYAIGNATIVPDARPDVEALYPGYPAANKAGWGFMILTNMMPDIPAQTVTGGVGAFTLYAVAHTVTGERRILGRTVVDQTGTRVTLANDTIAKPFGAIDTPTQGETVGGTLNNFGWALTPDPGTSVLVPTDGATISVFIDGAAVGTAQYNLCRGTVGSTVPAGVLCNDDVSTAFRGAGTRFRNLDAGRGPIGLRSINTTTLSNGLHTLSWGVTDSANRSEGIGSRYFTVLNSAADRCVSAECEVRGAELLRAPGTSGLRDSVVFARTGFDLLSAYTPLVPDADGVPQVRIPELGRVELQIPGVESGALIVNGEPRALPIGVGIDRDRGLVTWAPGPGYLGTYPLRFGSTRVDVTIAPASTSDEPVRMYLDSPTPGLVLSERSVRVEGWALDPQSAFGAGIGAVHVWARRTSAECAVRGSECVPIFFGVADINIPRPDVAAAHGAQCSNAGFRFTATLPAGEWEVTAYVWVTRTGRFEDARSVRVTIGR
jgi:hypothetical protein